MKLPNLLKCGYQNNMKISETDDTFYLDLHFFLNKAVDTYGKWNQKPSSHVNGENFLKDFFQSFYSKSQTFHIKISYFFSMKKELQLYIEFMTLNPMICSYSKKILNIIQWIYQFRKLHIYNENVLKPCMLAKIYLIYFTSYTLIFESGNLIFTLPRKDWKIYKHVL